MNAQSIFSIANQYFVSQAFDKAYVLYDMLAKMYPGFEPYKSNREVARPLLQGGKTAVPRKLIYRALHAAHFLAADQHPLQAQWCLAVAQQSPEAFMGQANAMPNKAAPEWLQAVNGYLASHGAAQLAATSPALAGDTHGLVLHQLQPAGAAPAAPTVAPAAGPLVTVMMSCYNAEKTLAYAVRSVLGQTHGNFELYIVNDNSTDGSAALAEQLAALDPRIKTLHNASNLGTYVSRNTVFAQCEGTYFTTLDADDLALPDRLEKQVAALEGSKRLVGTLGNWVRITPAGEFVFKNWTASYLHEAVATLMVRREVVLETIGYWDSVRYAADTEFYHRLMKRFGPEAVHKMERPLCFALYHPDSLTMNAQTGISEETGLSESRRAYRDAWKRWHQMNKRTRIEFPARYRVFDAPLEMQ